jgi:hypothetical protein
MVGGILVHVTLLLVIQVNAILFIVILMNDILLNVIIIIQIYSIRLCFIHWIVILPIVTLLSVILVIL